MFIQIIPSPIWRGNGGEIEIDRTWTLVPVRNTSSLVSQAISPQPLGAVAHRTKEGPWASLTEKFGEVGPLNEGATPPALVSVARRPGGFAI